MKELPDILDGDDEADIEIEIVEKCGLEYGDYAKDTSLLTKEIFESHFDKVLDLIHYYSGSVGYLVLGAFILNTGSRLPDDVKILILDAIDNDPYIGRSEEYQKAREEVLDDFREKVTNYQSGRVTEIM